MILTGATILLISSFIGPVQAKLQVNQLECLHNMAFRRKYKYQRIRPTAPLCCPLHFINVILIVSFPSVRPSSSSCCAVLNPLLSSSFHTTAKFDSVFLILTSGGRLHHTCYSGQLVNTAPMLWVHQKLRSGPDAWQRAHPQLHQGLRRLPHTRSQVTARVDRYRQVGVDY